MLSETRLMFYLFILFIYSCKHVNTASSVAYGMKAYVSKNSRVLRCDTDRHDRADNKI
jgi:hypothetical protein